MEFRAVLRLVGVDLPKEAVVGLDALQIVLAGGAVANDLETGAQILQTVGDVTNIVSAVTMLLADLGIGGDAMKQLADFVALGASLALVISSCGTNILADIGAVIAFINVVCDLSKDFAGDHDAAVADAKKNLSKNFNAAVHGFVDPQVAYATSQVKQYQAGQINYFDFVANVALFSPLEFKSFFPQLTCFFPSWQTVTISATGYGKSEGLFASQTDTEYYSTQFKEILTNKGQVESVLFNYFIGEPMRAFKQFFSVSQGISIQAASTLCMLLSAGNPDVSVTSDFDLLVACHILGITPSILGDDWLFKGFDKNELHLKDWKQALPYPPLTIRYKPVDPTGGVVINGKVAMTANEKTDQDARTKLIALQLQMQKLDEMGDIDGLMKIPEAVAILKKWATFSPEKVLSDKNNIFVKLSIGAAPSPMPRIGMPVELPPGGSPAQSNFVPTKPITPVQPGQPLVISDYWKCLSVTKKMLESALFADEASALADFGTIDTLNESVKRVQAYVIAKKLNLSARDNIATAFGTTGEKLGSRMTKNGTRVFYRKAG